MRDSGHDARQYLSLPVVPTFAGFDPRLQLLHEDDAVEAIVRATIGRHPGVFNISGDGVVLLSQAIGVMGGSPAPVLPPYGRWLSRLALRMLTGVGLPGAPGRYDRLRLGDGLHARRSRAWLETGLQLPSGDGCACDRQAGRAGRGSIAAPGVRAAGLPAAATPASAARQHLTPCATPLHPWAGRSPALITETTPRQRRRQSQKAEIVAPPPQGFRMPRTIRRLQRRAPMYALQGISALSSRLREVTGREVIDVNRIMEMAQFLYQQRELARRGPNYAVDDFGFDPQWTESFISVFKTIYRDYWRVEATGVEHVPSHGRGLLVANHAGVLPWDGTMIKTAVFTEHSHPRHVRALVASQFMGMPVMSWFLRRTGQAVGHPDDTRRLLERDELVLVFPEGTRGTGKSFRDRYRLRRFGRGVSSPPLSARGRPSSPSRWSAPRRSIPWSATSGPSPDFSACRIFP